MYEGLQKYPARVSIDVGGFNYREENLTEELIEELKLNPIQVFQLKCGKSLTLKGIITIELL